jgi:LytS/YehU family sensor histidine kinase
MFTRVNLIHQAGVFHFMLEIIVRNGLLATVVYANSFLLIPRLVHQRKFIAYGIALLLLLLFYALVKNLHDVYLYGYVLGDSDRQHFFYNTFYNLSIVLFYTAFSIALQLSREWYGQRALIRRIEIEKLNTELQYLKSQINPHFIFNSINTIYFQIDKKNTDARQTLSAFSDMLRYQLYECNGHVVPIEKEIRYLKSYVDLQRLRKDENYEIAFNCSENVKGFGIAPLLLICFIENAFKHVSHFPEKNRISISLTHDHDTFTLMVLNTVDRRQPNKNYEGIGLKNVKRRLQLVYPERHQLIVNEGQNDFEIRLDIKTMEYENELSDR